MTNNDLITLLQSDLRNERKHLAFYMQAAVMVKGLHRKELREFFEEEAQGEFKHVMEFSEAIVHLGGVPEVEVAPFRSQLGASIDILTYASEMELEVSDIYTSRLSQLALVNEGNKTAAAYLSVFYENQLEDSWKTAQEITQMIADF